MPVVVEGEVLRERELEDDPAAQPILGDVSQAVLDPVADPSFVIIDPGQLHAGRLSPCGGPSSPR